MLVLFFLQSLFFLLVQSETEKIIIDTDAGADDAIAILMLLRAEKLQPDKYEIVAITCTYGNAKEENVEINVLKTLTFANRSDIPVFRGAKQPLLGGYTFGNHFGEDGFGDWNFSQPILGQVNESMHASIALIELTKKYQGNISIIVLGPTTNIALAASLDENFISRVNKFHAMGSSVSGINFYKPNVEFNFGADPESNYIFLNSTNSSQLILFPYEAAYNTKIPKEWRTDVFGKIKSPYIDFLNAIERVSLPNFKDYYRSTDAKSIAALLWPDIVQSSLETNVDPVVDGKARGSVLVDYIPNSDNPKPVNAKIIQSIDGELFKEAMIYYLTCEKVAC